MPIVLIFSAEDDISTDRIMEWIETYDCIPVRVNNEQFITSSPEKYKFVLTNSSSTIAFSNIEICSSAVISVFVRKGGMGSNTIDRTILDTISEVNHAVNGVKETLKDKILVGRIEGDHNKLHQLNEAKKVGLLIPDTLITSSKKDLVDFMNQHGTIVTKAINIINPKHLKRKVKIFYTSIVNHRNLNTIAQVFAPSLFQRYIEKEYEIRSFYLHGKIYSMAIFSQQNTQTQIDYRDYSSKVPNRTVPCQLPANIAKKIVQLMKKLGLNTGSVDLIKACDGAYYFLEVNQSGQFGMVSYPCNYYLEEKIAKFLTPKIAFVDEKQ